MDINLILGQSWSQVLQTKHIVYFFTVHDGKILWLACKIHAILTYSSVSDLWKKSSFNFLKFISNAKNESISQKTAEKSPQEKLNFCKGQ